MAATLDFSTSTPLQIAKHMLLLYTEAEATLVSGSQEYKIRDKMFRKADLKEIQEGQELWRKKVEALDPSTVAPKRRVRCFRGVSCR